MAVREVNWLELPDHLTVLVTDKLSRCDFIRFGAVCKYWLSILVAHPRRSVLHQLPLLLLPGDVNCVDIQDIYEPIEKRISTFQVVVPNARTCRGSSHGWLFTTWEENRTPIIILKNPLLTAPMTIKIPALKDIDTHYITKAVLSANPASNPNYVIAVILSKHEKLTFFKPSGDKADWTYLETNSEKIDDILFYRDQFYFVDKSAIFFACDLSLRPDNPTVSHVLAPLPYSTYGLDDNEIKAEHLYLVEQSSGDILLVRRVHKYIEDCRSYTLGFSVYKMNPLVDLKWIEVQNLCGDTVFLSDCYSSSLRASDFPGCKQNCIYFADYGYYTSGDDLCGPDCVGIFNLEDGSIERQCPEEKPKVRVTWSPVWIEPTPLPQC